MCYIPKEVQSRLQLPFLQLFENPMTLWSDYSLMGMNQSLNASSDILTLILPSTKGSFLVLYPKISASYHFPYYHACLKIVFLTITLKPYCTFEIVGEN